jgi:acetylornithine deacetylase/succinyl-diaminopimelate desuccinylase-like protein
VPDRLKQPFGVYIFTGAELRLTDFLIRTPALPNHDRRLRIEALPTRRDCIGYGAARLLAAIALVSATWYGAGAAAATTPTAADPALGRDILRELVEIRSTHANGTTVAAKAVQARLVSAGFAPADAQLLVPAEHPESGNVVARLHGRNKGNAVLYLCHLDVVEAKAEDWTRDPFRLTEDAGFLYGRGTIDMKGQDSAVLASLIKLKHDGYVPDRDIVVAFTADEEAGGEANGVGWLLAHHRDLLDADVVINPDGGEAGTKSGRKLYVGVETSEKVFLTFQAEATDKGGHSSRPTGENPIYRLSGGLERLYKFQFPLHLTETTKLYFSRRAPLERGQMKSDMLSMAQPTPDPAVVARLSASVETNILLRTTCVATQIDGGHAENALPQRARATLQCRVIPGESQELIRDTLNRVLDDPGIRLSVLTPATPSPESPPSTAILGAVERVAHGIWPEVVILPQMAAGASDSRYTRSAGLPSYGIDGMFDDLDDGRAHGRDERISISAFTDEVQFTYRLMRELSRNQ